jgi:ankyrin repeat protein
MISNERFWKMLDGNEVDTVVKTLDTHSKFITMTDFDGRTLLHNGDMSKEMVIALTNAGVTSYNSQDDKEGLTPLMLMAQHKNVEAVKVLLRVVDEKSVVEEKSVVDDNKQTERDTSKTLVNTVDNWKRTPLIHAAGAGAVEVVKILLTSNADINAVDMWKRTPLMHAAYAGASEVVDVLLDNKADVNSVGRDDNKSALNLAIGPEMQEYCTRRQRDPGLVPPDTVIKNPELGWADIWSRRSAIVTRLIEKGALINHVDAEGCTALMMAASMGAVKVVTILLKAHADVKTTDMDVCLCAVRGFVGISRLLTTGWVGRIQASELTAFARLKPNFVEMIDLLHRNPDTRDMMITAFTTVSNVRIWNNGPTNQHIIKGLRDQLEEKHGAEQIQKHLTTHVNKDAASCIHSFMCYDGKNAE